MTATEEKIGLGRDIHIKGDLAIPEEEIKYASARSGGPGGQHADKADTKVTLRFPVEESPTLSREQKRLIQENLSNRINKEGELLISSQKHRSQAANRDTVRNRFADLLEDALTPDEPRRRTKVPRASKTRRLRNKRKHSRRKQERTWTPSDDDLY